MINTAQIEINKNKSLNIKLLTFIRLGVFFVGVLEFIFLSTVNKVSPHFELLPYLPLSFGFASLIFMPIYYYHRGGISLKILYTVIVLRYLVLPALLIKVGYSPFFSFASVESYRYATLIMILELFIACIVIKYTWKSCWAKATKIKSIQRSNYYNNRYFPFGFLFALGLIIISIARGSVFQRMGFLVLSEKYEVIDIYSLDLYGEVAILIAKSLLFIYITLWCLKKYKINNKNIYVVIALTAGFVNISIYFGYNRAAVFQTALATIFILLDAFPEKRKMLSATLIPIMASILISMILIKQFNTSIYESKGDVTNLEETVHTLEAYINGPSGIANSIEAVQAFGIYVTPMTFLNDLLDNIFFFKFPGLMDYVNKSDTTVAYFNKYLFNVSGPMLPLSGQALFYGGIFGVLVANFLAYYLIIKFEILYRIESRITWKYFYLSISIVFALAMCYCFSTIIWSISKYALLLGIVFWLNDRLMLKSKK